jgi:hypothetical protein
MDSVVHSDSWASMLRKETDRHFIVYPSWAQLPVKWDDLPRLLPEPLKSGFIEPNFNFRKYGFPERIQPLKLFDGPEGGGIIHWRGGPRERWLPGIVLTKNANMCPPNGMDLFEMSAYDAGEPGVAYLEPMGEPGWQLGVAKKPLQLRPCLSYEHVDGAGEMIYWVVRFKRPRSGNKIDKWLNRVPEWAHAFGLEARRLPEVPSSIRSTTDPWFPNPEYESAWFEVSGEDDGVGYHFAVVVYIGNHLRWVAGPCVDSMHLVADIEGKPRIRVGWNRKK